MKYGEVITAYYRKKMMLLVYFTATSVADGSAYTYTYI